ncbi:MAG: TetR/AcrR family transcriptional regulator [Polyangia bacterium]
MSIRVSRKKPDAYQHGDLHAALIQAGLKLLSEGGVPALSLRAAAKLAGVSNAAPYRHFKDKGALIAAIAEKGFRMLTAEMRREMDAAGTDFFARLRASAWGYVSFARAHPGYFRTMFGGVVHEDCAALSPAVDAAGEETYSVLREQVADGIRRGHLREADPDDLSLVAWSTVHGLGQLFIDGQLTRRATSDQAARALVDSTVRWLETGFRA